MLGVNWQPGQNLLRTLAILALLLLVIPLTLSGYGTYNAWGNFLGAEGMEAVHECFGNTFLAVVVGHIGLIVAGSLLRRRKQTLPTLTDPIEAVGPERAEHQHAWLAGLLLAAVLAFIIWQWQQSPDGLLPAQGMTQQGSERHHDDDD